MILEDVDWLRGEIRIIQSKTSNPVILPLTQDVGEVLEDYILNARPSTADHEIFLRIKAPHKSVCDVAQVFGDKDVNATKPYLAADTDHLKMCALSFEGITPAGGEAQ